MTAHKDSPRPPRSLTSLSMSASMSADSWYRFEEPAGTQMADSIVPGRHCGTDATGWLNGTHPAVLGENVIRQVCFNWDGNSCWRKTNVEIKNCGGFYLYKLKDTQTCSLKYCGQSLAADVSDIKVCT